MSQPHQPQDSSAMYESSATWWSSWIVLPLYPAAIEGDIILQNILNVTNCTLTWLQVKKCTEKVGKFFSKLKLQQNVVNFKVYLKYRF